VKPTYNEHAVRRAGDEARRRRDEPVRIEHVDNVWERGLAHVRVERRVRCEVN